MRERVIPNWNNKRIIRKLYYSFGIITHFFGLKKKKNNSKILIKVPSSSKEVAN